PSFPLITRPMPQTADCALQTDLALETRKIGLAGTFLTGLYMETMEGGVVTRYVFGLDAGTTYKAWRSSGGANYTQLNAVTYSGGDVTIRILRTGSTLSFQRKANGVWTDV